MARESGDEDQRPGTGPHVDEVHDVHEILDRERVLSEDLVNSLPGTFYLIDKSGRYLRWNKTLETVTGYSGEEIARMQPLDLFEGSDRERVAEAVREVFRKGQAEVHAQAVTKDRRRIPYFFTGRRIEVNGGPCLIGMGIDVSRNVETEERYRSLVESARDGIVSIAPDGLITSVNAAFEDMTGWPRARFIGRPFVDLVDGADATRALYAFKQVLDGTTPPTFELRLRADGEDAVPMEFTITPQRLGGQIVGALGIGRDIRERRRLEEQLRQVQKLDSIGQLAAGIAHDFNNILMVQQGHLSLLLRESDLDDVVADSLRQIDAATRRAATLTKQLLLLSRKQVMQPRSIALQEAVTQLAQLLGRALGEHIVVRLAFEDALPAVHADPGMIEQVVMNLAVNARDAMPDGGELEIGARAVHLDAEAARTNLEARAGRFVCLHVRDTGIGISDEIRAHIFEPFFTTKGVGHGTGLGLATVHAIVKQHQGWIEVESRPGKGATFRVYLPALAPRARTHLPSPMPIKPSTRNRHETILVVEDDAQVRNIVETILTGHGYRVLAAANGPEAIRLFDTTIEAIDLLFTDLVMPGGMSGWQLAERLRAERPDLPVLFTTGYDAEVAGKQISPSSGTAFLQKPYPSGRLLTTLEALLSERLR